MANVESVYVRYNEKHLTIIISKYGYDSKRLMEECKK